eukprot:1529554-Rhodomonas_salina.2
MSWGSVDDMLWASLCLWTHGGDVWGEERTWAVEGGAEAGVAGEGVVRTREEEQLDRLVVGRAHVDGAEQRRQPLAVPRHRVQQPRVARVAVDQRVRVAAGLERAPEEAGVPAQYRELDDAGVLLRNQQLQRVV